jgi:hypothetical protein
MQRHVHILFENYRKRHLDGKNCFAVENIQVISEGEFVNHFLRLEQYMFCITITELHSVESCWSKSFFSQPNKDRNHEGNGFMGSRDDTHNEVWGSHVLNEIQGSTFQ